MNENEEMRESAPLRSGVGAPGVGKIDYVSLPPSTTVRTIPLVAADGVGSRGILYSRGGEKTVVCMSHPRGDISQHYSIPFLLEAGFAAYAHQCRGLNNDVDCIHEELLLDLAAGFRHLKADLGFEKLVLLGNSGGGSLMSFYQEQASKPSAERLTHAPCGAPTPFDRLEMPKADGLMLLGAHAGAGIFLLNGIDPSIVDETDPMSIDPALDMYDPANGFRPLPEESRYSTAFLERYRMAQVERVRRIDARARGYLADIAHHQRLKNDAAFERMTAADKLNVDRRITVGHYMIIYRTEANPAYCDLGLQPWKSTRRVGSLAGARPDLVNYAAGGFARCLTPRAWLSSWSGLSSNAVVAKTIVAIHDPLLILSYTSDNGAFPDDNRKQLELCPAEDKQQAFVEADHYGLPLPRREEACGIVTRWLRDRFPVNADVGD